MVLLAVLPPILISSALEIGSGVVEVVSEGLAEYLARESAVISEKPVSKNCLRVTYGLAELRYGGTALVTPVLYLATTENVSKLLRADLSDVEKRCSPPIVMLPKTLVALGSVPSYVSLCRGGECLSACSTQHDLKDIGVPIAVGDPAGAGSSGFLCLLSALETSQLVAQSVVSEVNRFADAFFLLVLATYSPALYLVTLKIVRSIEREILVLKSLGVGNSKLSAAFSIFSSLLVLAVSTYSLALSYGVLLLARTALVSLGVALLPQPTLGLRVLLQPLALSSLEAALSRVVYARWCRGVA
ncbi:MAG: hypothetical protein RMH84_06185 [Sulfolobales archaeon]|nr:hypothetical protein [Sulfolobales archaeon]MDW8011161.1 hypothetical protein [Sulfolobales archaeon]